MKKFLFLLTAIILPSIMFAQVKVDANGHVGIGTTGTSFSSPLSVGGVGESGVVSSFTGNGTVTKIVGGTINSSACLGSLVLQTNNNESYDTRGIRLDVGNTSFNGTYNTIGLEVHLGSNNTGKVIGVSGCPITGQYGTGIFGSSSYPYYSSIDGKYAGFFYGNVKVTNGTINGTLTSSSDERLKEDIEEIADTERGEDGSVIGKLELLTPVSYRYKDMNAGKERGTYTDKDGNEVELPEEKTSQVITKRHFGFVAQELQQVYPDLVYENDNGYLSVNYTELIPILVQSIKELNAKVESLEADRANRSPLLREGGVRGGSDETASIGDDSLPFREGLGVGSSMDQNVPNPFSEKTDIAIFLPESVQTATLYIYDLSGKQIEQHPIEGRGNTVMTIHAERMDAGIYVYSLIADKKVVTTRKMIVVK